MKESFDKIFSKRGGVLKFDSEKSQSIINLGNSFIKNTRVKYPKLPEIYFDIIDNMDFGAASGKYEGKYYIGIYLGMINALEDTFMKINSAKQCIMSDYSKLSLAGTQFEYRNEIALLPFESVEIAIEQYQLIFKFFVYHEIGHILNGHLDLSTEKKMS